MHSLGAETWIMHGTLLGWWWGGRIMPWDDDLDVMMTLPTLESLVTHNMSLFSVPDAAENRTHVYLLDISSRLTNNNLDMLNTIDARWIDTETGLYVDITALRYDHLRAFYGNERGWLTAKDAHTYHMGRIFPLRQSTFEGSVVGLPNAYPEILADEYGVTSLTNDHFNGYSFDRETKRWEADTSRSRQGKGVPPVAGIGRQSPPHPQVHRTRLISADFMGLYGIFDEIESR